MKLEKDFVISAGTEVPAHFELRVKAMLGAKIEYYSPIFDEWIEWSHSWFLDNIKYRIAENEAKN